MAPFASSVRTCDSANDIQMISEWDKEKMAPIDRDFIRHKCMHFKTVSNDRSISGAPFLTLRWGHNWQGLLLGCHLEIGAILRHFYWSQLCDTFDLWIGLVTKRPQFTLHLIEDFTFEVMNKWQMGETLDHSSKGRIYENSWQRIIGIKNGKYKEYRNTAFSPLFSPHARIRLEIW